MTLDLLALRARLGWTQAQMASAIGLKLRAYNGIEGGRMALRPIHLLAVERVLLAQAAYRGAPSLAPDCVRDDALSVARAISADAKNLRKSATMASGKALTQ